jgi:hypothetical protein
VGWLFFISKIHAALRARRCARFNRLPLSAINIAMPG